MFSLKNPLIKIPTYVNFLQTFGKLQRLHKDKDHRLASAIGYITNPALKNPPKKYNDLDIYMKMIQYGILLDPTTLQSDHNTFRFLDTFGSMDWYELYEKPVKINQKLSIHYPVIHRHISTNNFILTRLQNQKEFVGKMLSNEYDVNEEMIENYKKFLCLKKDNPGLHIVPTVTIDIIWHGHMLDHACYVKDTIKTFGYILSHNDNLDTHNKNAITDGYKQTKNLWNKTYKENYEQIDNKFRTNISTSTNVNSSSAGCGACMSLYNYPTIHQDDTHIYYDTTNEKYHDVGINNDSVSSSCSSSSSSSCSSSSCSSSSCGSSCGGD